MVRQLPLQTKEQPPPVGHSTARWLAPLHFGDVPTQAWYANPPYKDSKGEGFAFIWSGTPTPPTKGFLGGSAIGQVRQPSLQRIPFWQTTKSGPMTAFEASFEAFILRDEVISIPKRLTGFQGRYPDRYAIPPYRRGDKGFLPEAMYANLPYKPTPKAAPKLGAGERP